MENGCSYQDMTVWQIAMDLVEDSYRLVKQFPSVDRFGLECRLLECAMDIPVLIADAHARSNSGVYVDNLNSALGVLAQLETRILIAERLLYCSENQKVRMFEKMQSIKWLLIRLRKSFYKSGAGNRETVSP